MGTLTAGQPRLPHYCEHKLPTSCRLSSIGECCACYDERAHAVSYSTYIDGIGYVLRGTRWQRYCWFCKEFWENRVQAAGLRPSETRIPEVPDLNEFLKRWYEFHQGFRVVQREGGGEERIAVLGEDWGDVSPGCLPRTIEELRAGRERAEWEEREREERDRRALAQEGGSREEAGPSLDEAIDELLQEANTEEGQAPPSASGGTVQSETDTVVPTATVVRESPVVPVTNHNVEYQARRVAALRRELQRMRNGMERVINGLRELGESVPDTTETSDRLADIDRALHTMSSSDIALPMSNPGASSTVTAPNAARSNDRSLANTQARVAEARRAVDRAESRRRNATSELARADQDLTASQARLRQLQHEQRSMENYIRTFGTREEMLAQGDNYESPIGSMFTRAWERFRVAEEVRGEERALRQNAIEHLNRDNRLDEETIRRLAAIESRERDVWGVPRVASNAPWDAPVHNQVGLENDTRPSLEIADLPGFNPERISNEDGLRRDTRRPPIVAGPPGETLDDDPSVNNDRGLDAVHVLSRLSTDDELRAYLPWQSNSTIIPDLLHRVQTNNLTHTDRENIESILANDDVAWRCGLPAERNQRRRDRLEAVTFTPDALTMSTNGIMIMHDVEIMAECFIESAEIRRRSGLSPPYQLRMLYTLQRGERPSSERATLEYLLTHPATFQLAATVHRTRLALPLTPPPQPTPNTSDAIRLSIARARALAELRTNPTTDPSPIPASTSDSPASTLRVNPNFPIPAPDPGNATYQPLTLADFRAAPSATESEPDTDAEDEAPRGLDARNSGRPAEPLDDEAMTLKMDCRICYAQIADVACLPCGHLVMCKWCSEQHSPVLAHDRTRPRHPANCPVCRKGIRQKVRIFRA